MTVKEKYQQLVDRVNLPENREKHKNCLNHPDDIDRELADLFEKVRKLVDHLPTVQNKDIEKKLCRIEAILDEKGWAK